MQPLSRRGLIVLVTAALGGCLSATSEPPVAADDGIVTPETTPRPAPTTPPVVTDSSLETRIEPAPLIVHEAPGFSFMYHGTGSNGRVGKTTEPPASSTSRPRDGFWVTSARGEQ